MRLSHESIFIPINRWNLILKIGGRKSSSYGTQALIHLSKRGEWIYGAQLLKERSLLCESIFIPIEKWTLILKMVERNIFLMKLRLQYYLSQKGKCVYIAQAWKERRLL